MRDSFIGYWTANSDADASQKEFMQITENRMIHYLVPEIGKKHMPLRVWFTHERNDTYKIQYRPSGNSWTREIFREGQDLIIRAENKDFRFTRITKDQVPPWFIDALQISLSKMDALEINEKKPNKKADWNSQNQPSAA